MPVGRALRAPTTHRHDYLNTYVSNLGGVIDMEAIRGATLRLGVDPLGGAGVHYWAPIAERYGLNLTVVSEIVDPTFGFMTVDWDGRIRMDPSSSYAMQRLIGLKDRFDIAVACDTDHDRHGIVTRERGVAAAQSLSRGRHPAPVPHRPRWRGDAGVGKTVVSSGMIDRVTAKLGRTLYEVPVGFKWFVDGLFDGSLGFGGEESAGASFLRRDGTVWTTDKDGIVPALLAAEITARTGRDPGEIYRELTRELGEPVYRPGRGAGHPGAEGAAVRALAAAGTVHAPRRRGGPAHPQPRSRQRRADRGLKVIAAGGWFAARPSGTEDIYKIYAESFRGADHLRRIVEEAQAIVDGALRGGTGGPDA